jgi:small subunit ribosomal protein S8
VLNGLGTAVISTPKGLLSDKDARNLLVGGEVICYIW